MFNVIGVTWMVIILPIFLPVLSSIAQNLLGIADPYTNATDMPIGLSAFHTAFNLLNVLIMIGFVNTLVKVAIWSVPDKEGDEDDYRLKFIGAGIRTPELAIPELQKETAHFGEITSRMSEFTKQLINTTDAKIQKKCHKKLRKYEKITDRVEIEITEYITNLTNQELTPQTSQKLRSFLNICNDMERIGDLYYQISKTIEAKNENKTYFVPEQRNGLNEMISLVDQAFAEMNKNLASNNYSKVDITDALQIEKDINKYRNHLRKENQSMLGSEGYTVESAMIYNNLFSSLERVGDHIMNVNESIIGEV
jgi:phosphate:Na+ symporter